MTDLQAHPTGEGLGGLLSDASLAEQAAGGDRAAFDELYRRHVESAWRVAQAVTGNKDDAADAVSEAFTKVLQALRAGRLTSAARFRPYLLQATRNAGIDVLRRTGRLRPTDSMDHLDGPAPAPGPGDVFLQGVDSSLVAAAFRSLPERWRAALWLTEVEGLPPSEAGPLLGVSANGAAQLAVRARAGLRDRFLQAHIGNDVSRSCRFTVEHLGAYVGGGLAPRDVAKVDQHLAGCDGCRDRLGEIEDLGSTLRRIALPLPLALAGVAAAKWKLAFAAGAALKTAAKGAGHRGALAGLTTRATKPLAGAATSLLALGIAAVPLVNRVTAPRLPAPQAAAAPPPSRTSITQPVPSTTSTSTPTAVLGDPHPDGLSTTDVTFAAAAAPTESTTSTTAPAGADAPLADTAASTTTTTTAPDGGSQPAPVVQVTVPVTVPGVPVTVVVSVGVGNGSCTGANVNGTVIGCDPGSGSTIPTTPTTLPGLIPTLPLTPHL